MKLNRWQVDRLHDLVAADIGRVSAERRESPDGSNEHDDLVLELSNLQLLRVKIDRLRKKNDLKKKR